MHFSELPDNTVIVSASSYLFLVGWADVEAGHNNCCPWHQVEFGVGASIVTGPADAHTQSQSLVSELRKLLDPDSGTTSHQFSRNLHLALSSQQRIDFKILTVMYKALNN